MTVRPKSTAIKDTQPPTPEDGNAPNNPGVERSLTRLEEVQDYLMQQFRKAKTIEAKLKLSNALASNCRALFQGYRAMTLLEGGVSPMEKAYRELKVLEFDED